MTIMMTCWLSLAGLFFVLQVPPPSAGSEEAQKLEAARRSIIAREASELNALARELARQEKNDAANLVRAELPRPLLPDGPTRFMPLPEVVEPSKPAPSSVAPPSGLKEIRKRAAAAFFDLAGEAARSESAQYRLASVCLRAAIERDADHKEARRLLGYVARDGGWATPFAVRQLKENNVNHPTFGWVPADWVPHLDRGELPAPLRKGQKKPRWLAVAEADRLRADWKSPWRFATEHFEIQTNVPLAEAITFGRRLEAFHDLFMTLFADILGENLPVIRLFKNATLQPDSLPPSRLHQVWYFGSKAEFIDHLSPKLGPEVALNLGFYDPPKSGRGRVPAYFYRDPDGQIPETATLYHEVSHQLLFESAGPNSYTKNVGNFWVFEGLGAYFETITSQPDGSLEVGGLVGPRIAEAYQALVVRHEAIPMAKFVAFDESTFRDKIQMYLNYQQAMALTVFLMQWNQGAYRDAFLDYVRDAYHGRIKRGIGRSLENRLHQPYATLEKQFLTFLKDAKASQNGPDPAETKPAPDAAIRTVPSR
jgi:Protein of unknown function (DUF1570)